MIQDHNERLQITVSKELAAKIRAASRRKCQTVSQYVAELAKVATEKIKPGQRVSNWELSGAGE